MSHSSYRNDRVHQKDAEIIGRSKVMETYDSQSSLLFLLVIIAKISDVKRLQWQASTESYNYHMDDGSILSMTSLTSIGIKAFVSEKERERLV